MKIQRSLCALLAMAFLVLGPSISKASITYEFFNDPSIQSGFNLVGTMTVGNSAITDGYLGYDEVEDFLFTLYRPDGSVAWSYDDVFYLQNFYNVRIDADSIYLVGGADDLSDDYGEFLLLFSSAEGIHYRRETGIFEPYRYPHNRYRGYYQEGFIGTEAFDYFENVDPTTEWTLATAISSSSAVPEPATLACWSAFAMVGIGLGVRRKLKK